VFRNIDELPTISSGLIWQVSSVELTNVVCFSMPLKTIFELEIKFVPVAAKVKDGMCETFEVGEIEDNVGIGFFTSSSPSSPPSSQPEIMRSIDDSNKNMRNLKLLIRMMPPF
jgi:hypothetical protein